MPFVLVIIGLLGGLQIYFFGVADRAQKSVAAQVLLSRSAKNVNQEVFLEQLLAVQVQELMRRESITALDLEKGVSSIVNAKNPANPEPDQKSPLFTPTSSAKSAAKQLTEFRELIVGEQKYRVKAFSSSLPRDPTGYLDLAVCPVKQEGMEEVDTRNPKKVRVRLSVKAGFLNAITGKTLYNVLMPGEVYGNVAEFDQRWWNNQWMSSRIYGNWLSGKAVNQPVTTWNKWPYNFDGGTEIYGYPSTEWWTQNAGPESEFRTMSMDSMLTDKFFKPAAFDPEKVNLARWQPWNTWRWWGYTLDGTQSHYDGPEIPWNPNTRSRSLPKFNPDMARLLARGTLSSEKVGAIQWIKYGKTWLEGPEILNALGPDKDTGLSVIDGNVIIDGREQPFRICGRVFVSGDIVVMGKYISKNEKDEPCPGALIAGRNIYVADNLVAADRADIFDRTKQANVEKLAQITKPSVEREIAEEIWEKGQLLLLATNNLVMGNPFPFEGKYVDVGGQRFIEPSIGNESAIVSSSTNIGKYWNEIYLHRATGVMSQAHEVGGKLCFTLPWENVETTCRSMNSSGDFASNERFFRIDVPTEEWLLAQDKYDAYRISMNYLIPEAYWKLFLPMNVSNRKTGELKPWITEDEFSAATFNAAENAKWVKPDACGRRNMLLTTRMPYREPSTLKSLPKFSSGFATEMDTDTLLKDIDHSTGFLTTYGDREVVYSKIRQANEATGVATPVPGNAVSVREMIRKNIDLCIQRARMPFVGKPGYSPKANDPSPDGVPVNPFFNYDTVSKLPDNVTEADVSPADAACYSNSSVRHDGTNFLMQSFWRHGNTDESKFLEPALIGAAGNERLKSQGQRFTPLGPPNASAAFPEAYLHMRCWINVFVAKDTPDCKGDDSDKFAVNFETNFWEGPGYLPKTAGGALCAQSQDSTVPIGWIGDMPTCIRDLVRIPHLRQAAGCSNVTGKYLYFFNNAPPGIDPNKYSFTGADLKIQISTDDGGQPWLYVDSRFLNGKVDADGKDRSDILKNRVKEVDGYIFSNQFIAHMSETVHDRSVQINGGISGRDFFGQLVSMIGPYRPGYDADPTKAYRTYYGGKFETGISVAWDPRFQYGEDILQSDIGTSELTENSSDVSALCEAKTE